VTHDRYDQAVADARTRLAAGEDLDLVIADMREKGMSEIPCIKAVRELLGVSLGRAKTLVHFSPAFADRREVGDAFQESLVGALQEINEIEVIIHDQVPEVGDPARQLGDLRAALAITLKMIKREPGPEGLTMLSLPTDGEMIREIHRLRDLAEAASVQQESTAATPAERDGDERPHAS
jgi:hypothetical protein